ncbi:WASH complex subunit 2 isoform X2 [Acipenser ruthenus]|uniref:WASH complex subunit 2 isoform X2 n=1 Tax=Acipenser ruthenus TaxID=7906 RepID=UPI0027419538|nr:WASH complex subunit 2 isoform X2 [Acipenser ruthenus]
MNGPSVSLFNGTTEQNGSEGEHIWERPWSLEEMRKTSENWSLAADSGLLLFLQDFSQRIMSKTHEIEKQLDGLIRDTKATDCCLHTVFNDFLMLSNTQFIENRVYDEEVEEAISKPDAGEKSSEQEKTREQKEAELIPKVQEAVNYGLRVLDSAFEQLDMKAGNSDSEDEESNDRVEPILEPKDLYVDRPLPYLIGSQLFMEQDDVGLGDLSSDEISIDSDRDSVVDSEEDHNEEHSEEGFDDHEDEVQSISKKKSSMISDEEEEDDDEEEGSDIFGDSEQDEDGDENTKNATAASSFADELAARIKGDVPSKQALSSVPSSTKKKGKAKKETKKVTTEDKEDDDELFKPPKMEDEDFSLFGGKGGLFSGGKGLFDDDEGDLFAEVPKQEQDEKTTKAPVSKENNLFQSTSVSVEAKQYGKQTEPKSQNAQKQATLGGLFDDEEDDFFSGTNVKTGSEKAKPKAAVDLFGADDDKDEDDDGDIFNANTNTSTSTVQRKDKNTEEEAHIPQKKLPAGAISMFGPGTKNLVENLRKRQPSTSEESEKSEENAPSQEIFKPLTKTVEKSQPSLFSDEEDSQEIFPSNQNTNKNKSNSAPLSQSKTKKSLLSFFDDEEEEDLFASASSKKAPEISAKKSQETKTPSQQTRKPVTSSLFSDDEDQWENSKQSRSIAQGDTKKESAKTKGTTTPKVLQNTSIFTDDDEDLFGSTKADGKKKPQRASLLFEEEHDDDEDKELLFNSKPTVSTTPPEIKQKPPAPSLFDNNKKDDLFDEPVKSKPAVEKPETKKKPAGAVSLLGGIDVLVQPPQDTAKTPQDDLENDEYLYKDAPPPLEEEPQNKKNILSLFDNEEEEEDQGPMISSKTPLKDTQKLAEQRPRTKSTGVFQDEELLFSQKQEKDNDPDVDLFATEGKTVTYENPAAKPQETTRASGVKAPLLDAAGDDEDDLFSKAVKTSKPAKSSTAAPGLFGDDEDDDLFSVVKPKQSLKPPEKKLSASVKDNKAESSETAVSKSPEPRRETTTLPKAEENEKPTGSAPIKSKEPSSRIGKLQANLAINPASLLPGSARRIPGAVTVTPGVGSLPSHSEGTQVTAASSQELGVSFDSPAQAQTLQTAIKSRAKVTGKRRPQTREARHLAAQLSDEVNGYGGAQSVSGAEASSSTVSTRPAHTPEIIPAEKQLFLNPAVSKLPTADKKPVQIEDTKLKLPEVTNDLFGSDDLFASSLAQKKAAVPKTEPENLENTTKPLPQPEKKETVHSIFDDQGGDLFLSSKQNSSKKAKSIPFLEDEEDDLFGAGKSTTVKDSKPVAQKESKLPKRDIFEDDIFETEVAKPPKNPKEKVLDSLFDGNIDIFADLTTTKPKEKKAKKKMETKSIFKDDMDDIFSSGSTKKTAKPQSKSKTSQPAKETDTTDGMGQSIFDDPLNALGGK